MADMMASAFSSGAADSAASASSGAASSGYGSMAMNVGGSLLQSVGQNMRADNYAQYGQEMQQSAQFQATQMRQNAGQAVAASQRSAADIQLQTDYTVSRALAVAAASGGGAQDPTIVSLIARTAGEGAYRQALALYQGEDKSRQMMEQAAATEYQGQMAARNAQSTANTGRFQAFTTAVKGGVSLYEKYGGGGPSGSSGVGLTTDGYHDAVYGD